jgi:hypothetical protein
MHHTYTQNHIGLLIVTCIKSRSISHKSVELLQACMCKCETETSDYKIEIGGMGGR